MNRPSLPHMAEETAAPLGAIAPPQRIAILLAIGKSEACVCHLESVLGWRQGYISQHLMALRKANVLTDRRKGRYVFYQLLEAQLPLVLIEGEVVSSGGKISVSLIRKKLEMVIDGEVFESRG